MNTNQDNQENRFPVISEADRMELTAALGLLRGHQYHGSADALERVLRGAGSLAAVQQGVPAEVPLPLLLRDIARDLGITVPQACIALKPLGNYSTNSAVTAEMAKLLRDSFPAPAHPAEGVQPIAKELADMLERSITGLGHYRDTANWSEADEEHINECNALLDRFACIDEATHPTQQGLEVLTDALTDCRRELQSCQSVIHLAGGFDPRYVSDAKAAIKKADAALAAQAKQGGV